MIEKVLEAARFAPSEHNTQTTEFVVIRDKAMIHEIGSLTAEYYAALARRIRNPVYWHSDVPVYGWTALNAGHP
jgi:nitroreductase